MAAKSLEALFPGHTPGPQTRRWWKKRTVIPGPLGFDPAQVRPFGSCTTLSERAPEGAFPALVLGQVAGCPVLLLVETDAIVTLHHDATLYEVAHALAARAETPTELAAALTERSSVLSLKSWLALARGVAAWPSFSPADLHPALRIRRISELAKWTLSKMLKALRANPGAVEVFGLDELLLADLVAGRRKLTKAKRGGPTIDLAWCYLEELPPIQSPRRLVLDGNPTLSEDAVVEALSSLQGLESVSVVDCDFDVERIRSALPGVVVRSGGEGLDARLRALAADAAAVTTLDLSDCALKALPPVVRSFENLEEIELAGNPKLDFEVACDLLATLPKLRRVGFRRCGLQRLPDGLRKLRGLASLDLAYDYGGQGNRFRDTNATVAALHALPRLEEVNLGTFTRKWQQHEEEVELPVLDSLSTVRFEEVPGDWTVPAVYPWLKALPALRSVDVLGQDPARAEFLTAIPTLRSVVLRGPVAAAVDPIVAAHPELEALSFEWHHLVPPWEERKTAPPVAFPESIRGLPGLKRLEVVWGERGNHYGVAVEPGPEWLSELSELEQVDITIYDKSAWKELPEGLFTSPLLRHVRIHMEDRQVRALPAALLTHPLRTLDLRGTFTESQLQVPPTVEVLRARGLAVTGLPACRELREARAGSLSDDELVGIAGLPELVSLTAHWTGRLGHPASRIRTLEGSGPVGHLPLLEHFRATGDLQVEGPLPALRSISWCPGSRCTDYAAQLGSLVGLPNLRRLSIDNFWPKPAVLPETLRQLGQLDELRFFATGLQRIPGAKATLQEWLPDTKIVFG